MYNLILKYLILKTTLKNLQFKKNDRVAKSYLICIFWKSEFETIWRRIRQLPKGTDIRRLSVYYHEHPWTRRGAEPRVERKRSTSGRATSAALRTRTHTLLPPLFPLHTHTPSYSHTQPTTHLARSHNRMTTAALPLLHPFDRRHPSLSVTRFLCFSLRDREKEGNEQRREKRGTRFE